MTGTKILVVETDVLSRRLIRTLLTLGRYQVLEAADPEAGLGLARESRPACILMDLRLPGTEGLTAVRILKADPLLSKVPVVALTSAIMSGDERRALDAGCDGYIARPIHPRAFLENIRRFLQLTGAAGSAEESLASEKPRVLVVDDEPEVRALFTAWLEHAGYLPIEAASGAEALARAHGDDPDLILLDIVMPDIDGFEVSRRLKGGLGTLAIPIILITGHADSQARTKGVEAGADEFLTKPVDRVELMVRIKSMLRLKRVQERLARGARPEDLPDADVSSEEGPRETRPPVVLLAERDEAVARQLETELGGSGCRVVRAAGGEETLATVSEAGVDVLLLGELAPGAAAGAEVCRFLKDEEATRNLQIIVLSRSKDPGERVAALERGADDFLPVPVDAEELTARVRQHAKRKARLDTLLARYRSAVSAAASDGLTGLANNTEFKRLLDLELKRSRRHASHGALLIMDVDDFKQRNDSHGHLVGDMLLAELAQVVKGAIRDIDLAARYGGEEFAVLLPQTDAPGARVVAERLRSTIAGHRFLEGSAIAMDPVTVSVGVACFPAESAIVEELISLADQRLYRAKRDGKNRICVQL